MKIAALGRTRILYNTIKALHSNGHQIVLIATCKPAPEYDVREKEFAILAKKVDAKFIYTQNINNSDIIQNFIESGPEIAVSINWVNLIGKEACQFFKHGILNAHAGDLPRYRGNAPVAWAILNGENKIGITIHKMDPNRIDAGPIILKYFHKIDDNTYIGDVFRFLEKKIPELFVKAIHLLEQKNIRLQNQSENPSDSLQCFSRRPSDAKIDWTLPSLYIHRLIRASSEPFSGAYCIYDKKKITVWRGFLDNFPSPFLAIPGQILERNKDDGSVLVSTGDGAIRLIEIEIDHEGRKKPQEIIKSLRDRLE